MKLKMRKLIFIFVLCFTTGRNVLSTEAKELDSSYYYNQLNSTEQKIYHALDASKENFLSGQKEIYLEMCPDQKEGYLYAFDMWQRATKAFAYDNPEVEIWFHHYKKSHEYMGNNVYLHLTLATPLSSNIREQPQELEKEASKFVATLSGTDTEKLVQIHHWLLTEASYDGSLQFPNIENPYGAIVQGKAICSGFAYAFKYTAELAGLDVIYVTGKFYDSETCMFMPHAWNVVCIDGTYSIVDVTLDLPRKKGEDVKETYLFSPINDGKHFIDKHYFKYPF